MCKCSILNLALFKRYIELLPSDPPPPLPLTDKQPVWSAACSDMPTEYFLMAGWHNDTVIE